MRKGIRTRGSTPVVRTLLETIADRYRLIRRLGSGGMAEVWLAEQVGPRDFVRRTVLKRIHAHLADDEKFVRAFEDEARLAARLQHPNIVRIEDFGEDAGSLFLVMEYVGRWDLRSLVNQAQGAGIALPVNLVLQLGAQIADALHYAHHFCDIEGESLRIVHRDVSPQNIMLTDAGQAKLLDFGIAKAASNRDKTRTGMLKGKLAYLSPEQATGDPVDGRTDQYALGIVLYELLARVRLFAADSEISTFRKVSAAEVPDLHSLCPELSPDVAGCIARALRRDPNDRYPDARRFARNLEALLPAVGGPFGPDDFSQLIRRLEASDSLPNALPYLSETMVSRALSEASQTDTDDVETLFRDVGDLSRTEPEIDSIHSEKTVAQPTSLSQHESRFETATLHMDNLQNRGAEIIQETRVMESAPSTDTFDGYRGAKATSSEPKGAFRLYPLLLILLLGAVTFLTISITTSNPGKPPLKTPTVEKKENATEQAVIQVPKKQSEPPVKATENQVEKPKKPKPPKRPLKVKKYQQSKSLKSFSSPKKQEVKPRRTPKPPVALTEPQTTQSSGLSKDDLDAPLFKHFQQILDCQSRHSGAGIKVNIKLKIQPSGRPGILGIQGAKGAYAGCLEETISSWRWPRFSGASQKHIITF